jgi:predicted AlkP superfamily phosphohydrolase/phosphomutase
VEKYGNAILDLWKKQDAILGRMLALIPEDATVMMMSDHGFDAIYRQVNMANWVAQTEVPDLLKTMAVPPLNITNGILHYSLQSQLAGGSDREAFLDRFIQMCKDLEDPETGVHPFQYIFRREDIYKGRMLEKAPDLVFHEHAKYFVTRGKPDSTDMPIFQNVWTTSFSATHRPEGIFALKGPGVKKNTSGTLRERLAAGGDFQHANIIDVAPTMLAMMDQPVPDAMDGRVLTEGLTGDFLAAHPVKVEEVPGFLLDRPEPSDMSDEERQQLKSIPYIQ